MTREQNILKKKTFYFKKASLSKWEGVKNAGGCWPFCFVFHLSTSNDF